MEYLSVAQIAQKWKLSERSVRNYCNLGKVQGAFLTGKTWNIPADAVKPDRKNIKQCTCNNLTNILKAEKEKRVKGGIYHKTQILLSYNSNHIEGSRLTEEQTRYIYETNTIGISGGNVNVDDVIETTNHFKCFDLIIDNASKMLNEKIIKELHFTLKVGTSDSQKEWFNIGDYKLKPNEVGGRETCSPSQVPLKMKQLLNKYNSKLKKSLEDIVEFHHDFEAIHPFQDGNGRVGRLILFKECLKNGIVPFIIDEDLKYYYYRGLKEWNNEKGYLQDTCRSAQDKYKKYLDYFEIGY